MDKGHDELDLVDPDTLDDDAFLKERDKLLEQQGADDKSDEAGPSLDDKPDGDTGQQDKKEVQDKAKPAEKALDGQEPETKTPKSDEKSDKKPETSGEPEPFSLDGTKTEKKEDQEPSFRIVHNGQAFDLTKDEMIRRAQMGTDYDAKMTQIAPYRRLIEIVNKDKRLADLITRYIQNEGNIPEAAPEGPKLKPLGDYTGDDAAEKWLMDGVRAFVQDQESRKPAQQQPQSVEQRFPLAVQAKAMLSMMEPDDAAFDVVFPEMVRLLPTLKPEDVMTINTQCAQGDFRGIRKFYQWVKTNKVGNTVKTPQNSSEVPVQQQSAADKFRVRPGGGKPPHDTVEGVDDLPDAFAISEADFRKTVARLKGHA